MPEFKEGDRVQLRWSEEMLLCRAVDRSDHDGQLGTISGIGFPCSTCPWQQTRRHVYVDGSHDLHCWPESHMELIEGASEEAGKEPEMSARIGTWAYEIVAKAKVDEDGNEFKAMKQVAKGEGLTKEPTEKGLLFMNHQAIADAKETYDNVEVNIVRPFVRE